jgi:nucleotide-binding universal stress UspA family protein
MKRILLAVNGFPTSQAALAACAEIALRFDAEVTALAVREREITGGVVWERRRPIDTAELVSVASYRLRRAGLNVRGLVRRALEGRVADEIVFAAHELKADLIVIGSRTPSRLRGLLFGSVSQRVLRRTDIPVLVVPSPRGGRLREVGRIPSARLNS